MLCLAAPASATPPVPRKLPPVEQCAGDPAFDIFREKLTKAVLTMDRDGLLSLTAPDAFADFAGGQGPAALGEHIDNAGDEYWQELKLIIKLGCARSGQARVIPSLVVQFEPWSEIADGELLMVVLPGAKLRTTPDQASPVTATLAWDVVKIIPGGDFQTEIILADGRRGWLADDELAGPYGYRFYIEKRDGKWMLTALVAGD